MPATTTEDCPQRDVLSDFLLGKLDPKASSQCEQHLASCPPCVETISSLDVGDTFEQLLVESGSASGEKPDVADESIVGNLVHRLSDLQSVATAKTIDQRAADVVALLEPSDDAAFIGGVDHYQIESILGVGSSGVVFRAIDTNLDRHVAIKVLRPSLGDAARQRFIAEARATAQLNHVNIVSIYHVGVSGSLAYIVMQWLPGETLEHRLQRQSVLPCETVRDFGVQIASGLDVAHQKGLVHRDIKPANLWISEDGQIKILDFGLVRIMDESPQLTCTGMIAGTPCFMSPEQSRGDQLDARSDLFSLGCVMYQALTGSLPFESTNALATLQAIQRQQPTAPAKLDTSIAADLSDLVMKLLEKSPHRRPDSASEFAHAIEAPRHRWKFECDDYTRTNADHAAVDSKKQLPHRKRSILWPAVALLLVATGFFGWMYGQQIVLIATDQGEIRIESSDPDVQVEVRQNGRLIEIVDVQTSQKIRVRSGTYQILGSGDENSVSIDKGELTLSRGETEIVRVTQSDQPTNNSLDSHQAGKSPSLQSNLPSNVDRSLAFDPNYRVKPGDVLNVFITNVLGSLEATQNLDQHLGIPISVRGDGSISLPLVEPLFVSDKTAQEIEKLIQKKYFEGDNPILTKDWSFVSVSLREVFDQSDRKLGVSQSPSDRLPPNSQMEEQLVEPVYQGKTLREYVNVVKYERDGSLLIDPLHAMLQLSDSNKHPELVDVACDAALEIYEAMGSGGLGLGHRSTEAVLDWLSDEQLSELMIRVTAGRDLAQWACFVRHLDLRYDSRLSKDVKEQIAENIVLAMKDESQVRDMATTGVLNLIDNGIIEKGSYADSLNTLLAFAKRNQDASAYKILASNFPKLEGLGSAMSESLKGRAGHVSFDEMNWWTSAIANCDIKNQKLTTPGFAKLIFALKPNNMPESVWPLILKVINKLPDDSVEPMLELCLESPKSWAAQMLANGDKRFDLLSSQKADK